MESTASKGRGCHKEMQRQELCRSDRLAEVDINSQKSEEEQVDNICSSDQDDDYHPEEVKRHSSSTRSTSKITQVQMEQRYQTLKELTKDFTLTYTEIKNRVEVKSGSLSDLSQKEITNIIRRERQNLKRKRRHNPQKSEPNTSAYSGNKRSFSQAELAYDDFEAGKRQCQDHIDRSSNIDYSLALSSISNFQSLGTEFQHRVLSKIDELLKGEPTLLQQALTNQVQLFEREATQFYETLQLEKLTDLLSSLSPMTAILLNIKISLTNSNLLEQGNTLSQLLLPYINKCSDFSFLSSEHNYIGSQFLKALVQHIKDTDSDVGQGFMIFALKINPSDLQLIVGCGQNTTVLYETFLSLGYSEKSSRQIKTYPAKFLWPELLAFFKGKPRDMIDNCVQVLAKLDIVKDPGSQMSSLVEIFGARRLIVDKLLAADKIELSLAKLLILLEDLRPMRSDTIQQVLQQPSSVWERETRQHQSKEDQSDQKLTLEQLTEVYNAQTQSLAQRLDLEEVFNISRMVSDEVGVYRHCEYQAMVAAAVISQSSNFVVTTLPTGSGKTWIQAIIAKYFCTNGKRVTIIEPNEQLRLQVSDSIGLVDFGVSVYSIEQFYQYGSQDEVLIIDEYDQVMRDFAFCMQQSSLSGVWLFKNRNVFAFSATSCRSVERFVNNCISPSRVLSFKSEYELIHGVNPIQDGHVVQCGSYANMLAEVEGELVKSYDSKPIIVVYGLEQLEDIRAIFKRNKFIHYEGVSQSTLLQIRDLSHGICAVERAECRGMDVRFAKDAMVMITCSPSDYNEYLQMLGRSSRSRNMCEGILYSPTSEKPGQILERLKRANISLMLDLERLVKLLEEKRKDKQLLARLKEQEEICQKMRSCKELEALLGRELYAKVTKNLKL